MSKTSSTPTFSEFSPDHIPYQRKVIRLIRKEYDYDKGILEVLLSGSVGSAKSILAAHLAVLHCCTYPNARILLGRKALPDLKDTILKKIMEHMEGSFTRTHYWHNITTGKIKFTNGSEIICRSWSDKKYKKMRSLELSGAIIEELTENNEEDKQAYDEIKMRVGRLPHIKENWIISCTNPDSPSHWAYEYFMNADYDTRRVFYSITTDNPFLPKSYVNQLKNELDAKLAQRMIYGKWIDLDEEVIYYNYSKQDNYVNGEYEISHKYPIIISWDFNIGEGKPLSCAIGQYDQISDEFHWFDEIVTEGMRTSDSLDALADQGILDHKNTYLVCGDAAGRAKDTRNVRSDYDIIQKFLGNYKNKDGKLIKYAMRVPKANPPIRTRHNLINGYCKNANGKVGLKVYKKAGTVDKGLRLTKLKKGGAYIEDDSKPYQHITTAIGYAMFVISRRNAIKPQGTVRF